MNRGKKIGLKQGLRAGLKGPAQRSWLPSLHGFGKSKANRAVHVSSVDKLGQRLPETVPGLALWLDAEQMGYPVQPGQAVSRWDAAYPAGQRLEQTTAVLQPTWSPSGMNGRPALRFVNYNFLQGSGAALLAPLVGSNNYTFFIVSQAEATTANGPIVAMESGTGAICYLSERELRFLHRSPPGNSGGDNLQTAGQTYPQSPNLLMFQRRTTGMRVLRNGAPQLSLSTLTAPAWSASDINRFFCVGARPSPAPQDRYFVGLISEILCYEGALTVKQMTTVVRYLASKYNIPQAEWML